MDICRNDANDDVLIFYFITTYIPPFFNKLPCCSSHCGLNESRFSSSIQYFDLEQTKDCAWDNLAIHDGNINSSLLLVPACGTIHSGSLPR